MGRVLLGMALLFVFSGTQSQIIDNSKGVLLEGESYFSRPFVKRNKIKRIVGERSIKRELQPIQSKGLIDVYEFDQNGLLREKLKTFRLRGGEIDTSEHAFSYNSLDQLIQKTLQEKSGFNSYKYQYDDSGRVVSQGYMRGQNLSPYQYQLQKGKETYIKEESFRYEQASDSSYKRIYLNSNGIPYMEGEIVFNAMGYKSVERLYYKSTGGRSEIQFFYNEDGQLKRILKKSKIFRSKTHEYFYEYDEFGNVLREKTYRDDRLVFTREFLYEVDTLLLKAELYKDEKENSIHIIRFRYEYF